MIDSYSLLIHFRFTGGEVHDCKEAPDLIAELPKADYIIVDQGYDSEELRTQIRDQEAIPVIPGKKNSRTANDDIDCCFYKYQDLIENVFARFKHFRVIATRYEQLKQNFEGSLALACAFLGCLCETVTAPILKYLSLLFFSKADSMSHNVNYYINNPSELIFLVLTVKTMADFFFLTTALS